MGILLMILLQNVVFGLYVSYRIYISFFSEYRALTAVPVIFLINDSFLILRVLSKNFGFIPPDWLSLIVHMILGLTVYLFLFFLASDIIRIVFKIAGKPFISQLMQGVAVAGLSLVLLIYGYWNSHNAKIKSYAVSLNKPAAAPFRIAAVSDIHIGADMSAARLAKIADRINGFSPSLIFIAGDTIDHDIRDFSEKHKEAFKKLSAPYGVYAVMGNHEYYSGDPDEIIDVFNQAGMTVLKDEAEYIEALGVYVLGRDSLRHTNSDGSERKSIDELAPLIEDKEKPVIILDHVPKGTKDGEKIGADIQISGHTHDGQFFPVNFIVRAMYPLSSGMLDINGFHFFVSSGLGLWGPPMRVGTDSEILIIDVK